MRPFGVPSTPTSASHAGTVGEKPNAMITTSASSTDSLPSIGTALWRPRSSGSPSFVSTTCTPATLSSTPATMASGWRLNRKRTPSSRALATSRAEPGMFASSRR